MAGAEEQRTQAYCPRCGFIPRVPRTTCPVCARALVARGPEGIDAKRSPAGGLLVLGAGLAIVAGGLAVAVLDNDTDFGEINAGIPQLMPPDSGVLGISESGGDEKDRRDGEERSGKLGDDDGDGHGDGDGDGDGDGLREEAGDAAGLLAADDGDGLPEPAPPAGTTVPVRRTAVGGAARNGLPAPELIGAASVGPGMNPDREVGATARTTDAAKTSPAHPATAFDGSGAPRTGSLARALHRPPSTRPSASHATLPMPPRSPTASESATMRMVVARRIAAYVTKLTPRPRPCGAGGESTSEFGAATGEPTSSADCSAIETAPSHQSLARGTSIRGQKLAISSRRRALS